MNINSQEYWDKINDNFDLLLWEQRNTLSEREKLNKSAITRIYEQCEYVNEGMNSELAIVHIMHIIEHLREQLQEHIIKD